jgi:N6-adenosine-specific RNA methylase IME4
MGERLKGGSGMKIGEYETHPAADRFPLLEGEPFQDLLEDVKANGLLHAVVLCDGKILDGRNRMRACLEAGVEPRFTTYPGDNPFRYVWSTNGARRDLEKLQRTTIKLLLEDDAAGYDKLKQQAGKRRSEAAKKQHQVSNPRAGERSGPHQHDADQKPKNDHVSAEALGKELGVSSATVQRADHLIKHNRELAEKVARGEVKGMQAMREIKRSQLAGKVEALPEGKHRVIYADPPWKYGDERAGLDVSESAAAAQYPTMSVSELCALDVKSIAADDAVLFCWATFPLLTDALEVVKAWGFKYKTAIVWDKVRSNLGNYHNASAELLLICTRGSCTPETDKRPDQVQVVERKGRHSEKPEHFRELIDSVYPTGPRIELFRRGEAPNGWAVWGNEAEHAA